MKRNQKARVYGLNLIRKIKTEDFKQLASIRDILGDVSTFIQGLLWQIGEDHSNGDTFDYKGFDRKSKSYISRIQTYVNSQYDRIAKTVTKIQKDVYYGYRKDFDIALRKMDILPKVVSEAGLSVSFGGTPTQSFTRHLRKQLRLGLNPADLIKTVSPQHVRMIQRQLLTAVSKGKSFGWAKDRVMKEMYPLKVDRLIQQTVQSDITRIMRTSYMQAVNLDTTDFVGDNTNIFYGSRRVADGRPCFACIVLDGMFYPPNEPMQDHPNGQCVLVPLAYPDEYFETGKITRPIKDTFDKPMLQKFYEAGDADQMRMMGNRSLYRLWKTEKFDPSKAIVGPFKSTPMSYRQAIADLPKMGGISAPKVDFFNPSLKSSLNPILDPKDRLASGDTVLRRKPKIAVDSRGIDLVGDGSDFLKADISNQLKAQISALYGEGSNLHWITFNERARLLGILTRKDMTGKLYYVVDSKKVKSLMPKKAVKAKPKALPSEISLEDYVKLDADIDLVAGKGIDKIRWNADGTRARILRDANLIEGQEIRIYKMWNPVTKKHYYTVELKVTKPGAERLSKMFDRFQTRKAGPKVFHYEGKGVADIRVNTLKEVNGRKVLVQENMSVIDNSIQNILEVDLEDVNVRFYQSSLNDVRSFDNRVFLDIDVEDFSDAMKAAQKAFTSLDLEEAFAAMTEEDAALFLRNRAIWADKKLASKSASNVYFEDFDDYMVPYQDLSSSEALDNVINLTHDTKRGSGLVDMFDSEKLLSTDSRIMTGIGDFYSGQSMIEDILSGGSNGAFTRMFSKDSFSVARGYVRVVIDKRQLNRLDWYGFSRDRYGKTSAIKKFFRGRQGFLNEQLKRPSIGNELVFRNGISSKHVLKIQVATEKLKQELIQDFIAKGIFKINGKILETFIEVVS